MQQIKIDFFFLLFIELTPVFTPFLRKLNEIKILLDHRVTFSFGGDYSQKTCKFYPKQPQKPTKTVSGTILTTTDKANLKWVDQPPSFHEIRSLADRTYENVGVDTQVLLGNKDRRMTDKYADMRGGGSGYNLSEKKHSPPLNWLTTQKKLTK